MWNDHKKTAWDICLRSFILALLFLTGMGNDSKLAEERLRPQDLENDSDDPRTELEKLKRILLIETQRPKPDSWQGRSEGNCGLLLRMICEVEGDLYSLPPDHFNQTICYDVSNEEWRNFMVASDSTWATMKGKPRSKTGPYDSIVSVLPDKKVTFVAHRGGEMQQALGHILQDFGWFLEKLDRAHPGADRSFEGEIHMPWSGNDVSGPMLSKKTRAFTCEVTYPSEQKIKTSVKLAESARRFRRFLVFGPSNHAEWGLPPAFEEFANKLLESLRNTEIPVFSMINVYSNHALWQHPPGDLWHFMPESHDAMAQVHLAACNYGQLFDHIRLMHNGGQI